MAQRSSLREDPTLTQITFGRLLEWLDDGVESHGETYLEMRRRLASYFDRRDRHSPNELADETLNRVARTLGEAGAIAVTPPARYCYIVARFVLLEDFRRERLQVPFDDPGIGDSLMRRGVRPGDTDEGAVIREQRLECLDRCLQTLKPEQRELVLEYYRDAGRQKIERRRAVAARLGISMNALAIRACRIRDSLEKCVAACRKARQI